MVAVWRSIWLLQVGNKEGGREKQVLVSGRQVFSLKYSLELLITGALVLHPLKPAQESPHIAYLVLKLYVMNLI